LFQSWLETIPSTLKSVVRGKLQVLFDSYVPSLLFQLRRYYNEPLPTVSNCLVDALLNLLDTFMGEYRERDDGSEKKSPEEINAFSQRVENIFIFCSIWSMCCTVNAASRKMFDSFFRKEMDAKKCQARSPKE